MALVGSYHFFDDIEDRELRTKNRAQVLANIMEDNIAKVEGKTSITSRGTALLMEYFGKIAADERKDVLKLFSDEVFTRGYRYAI